MKMIPVATSSGCCGGQYSAPRCWGVVHVRPRYTVNTRWVAAILYFHNHHHLCSCYRKSFPSNSLLLPGPAPTRTTGGFSICSPCSATMTSRATTQYNFGGCPSPRVCVTGAPAVVQGTAHVAVHGRSDRISQEQSELPAASGACSVGVSEVPVGWKAALEWMEGQADTWLD